MGAIWLSCLWALQCLFIQRVTGQTEKIPAMWNLQQASVYPNPLVDDAKCKAEAPMRICDPNEVLNSSNRSAINLQLREVEELSKSNISSDVINCQVPKIVVPVLLMKSLGPDVHDFKTEAKALAERFHEIWKVQNLSLILVASSENKEYYLRADPSVVNLLPSNSINALDQMLNATFSTGGQLENAIKQMVAEFRKLVVQSVQDCASKAQNEMTTQSPKSGGTDSTIIVIIIIVVVLIAVVLIIVVIVIKRCRKKSKDIPKEKEMTEMHRAAGTNETDHLTGKAQQENPTSATA